MKHFALLSLTLMLCLLTTGVDAKTYVTANGDVYHTRTIEKTFKITGEGQRKLKVTMSCDANKAGNGTMRAYFFKRSPQGGWNQIDHLKIQVHGSLKETTDTFTLPEGEYKCEIKVRRVKYSFKLEDG